MPESTRQRTSREAAVDMAASTENPGNEFRAIALGLVYVGDQIGHLEPADMERVSVELGGIGQALNNVADEIGQGA